MKYNLEVKNKISALPQGPECLRNLMAPRITKKIVLNGQDFRFYTLIAILESKENDASFFASIPTNLCKPMEYFTC